MTITVLVVAVIALALAFLWALRRAYLYKWLWEGECSLNDALVRGEESSHSATHKPRRAAEGLSEKANGALNEHSRRGT
jgi:hypothetical protein